MIEIARNLPANEKRLQDFSLSKEGVELFNKYAGGPETTDTWVVNSAFDDMGGRSSPTILGYFQGTLNDVVVHAVYFLPKFSGYHCWGTIEPLKIVKVSKENTEQQLELRARKAALEKELLEIQSKIL